jgi:HlyD family secretion protein
MDGSGSRLSGVVVDVGQMVARKIVLTNDPVSDTDARVVEVRIALDAQWSQQVARLSNARIEAFIQLDTPQKLPADPPQTTSTN